MKFHFILDRERGNNMGYVSELRNLVGSRPLILPGANVILLNSDHQLLLQLRQDNDCWGLPGGALEPGETLEQSAKRELFEETGLQAKSLNLFNIFSGEDFYYQYPHGDEVYNVIASYTCTDYEGEILIDVEEVKELRFFDINQLPKKINPPELPIIMKYLEQADDNKSINKCK